MSITVEDGSIVSGANSYVEHTDLAAYATLRNITLTDTQADREALLIKAMDRLAQYANLWKGNRVSASQPLEWPRTGVQLYRYDAYIATTAIPDELKNLQMVFALAAIDVELLPTHAVSRSGNVSRQRLEGVMDVQYENTGKLMRLPAVTSADALLGVLLRGSGLGRLELVRA